MQNGAPTHMATNGQAGNNWLQPNSASPSHQFTGPQLTAGGMQITPNTPLQHQPQPANGSVGMPGQGLLQPPQPPRSGPTPLQHMSNAGNPMPQRSPNMATTMGGVSAQPPMGIIPAQAQASQGPRPNTYPAMPGPAFQAAYSQYCQKHGIQHDEQLLHIEGKRIDLHRLHQEVIAAGTFERVSILWIINASGVELPPIALEQPRSLGGHRWATGLHSIPRNARRAAEVWSRRRTEASACLQGISLRLRLHVLAVSFYAASASTRAAGEWSLSPRP